MRLSLLPLQRWPSPNVRRVGFRINSFRGLIERSLALRPASSRDHQVTLSIEGSDEFVASFAASIATGQATLPRRDFHPLKHTRIHGARTFYFSQRRISSDPLLILPGAIGEGAVRRERRRRWLRVKHPPLH